jgi:hypothetical protein
MYYSNKLSLLLVACPKTGTKSVEDYLMKIDPDGHRHRLELNGKTISSKDLYFGSITHAHAWEFRDALGEEVFNKTNVFV